MAKGSVTARGRASLVTRHLSLLFCLTSSVFCLLSCAQQGSLTGGPKDEKPPEILASDPPNYSIHFAAPVVKILFNEYFVLKEIQKQLVISPPMAKKPEFKIRGKELEILFKDSLLPDRTYAINFGEAIADLNEGNAIKNFQYVFSTGSTIDSLEVSGKVVMALDGKPAEDVTVMLYAGSSDTLPLKSMPLYIARTTKEGKFTLKNVAGGAYQIFALKDGNTNYRYDMPTESIAFQDSLIRPFAVGETLPDSTKTSPDTAAVKRDSLLRQTVPVKTGKDTLPAGKIRNKKETILPDTLPKKPKYLLKPDDVELRLFTEVKAKQYLSSTDRLRRDQVRLQFAERIDTLDVNFLHVPPDSVRLAAEWYGEADTLDIWLMSRYLFGQDSLTAVVTVPANDSLERRVMKSDTLKLRYRQAAKPAGAPKKEFTLATTVESSKTLDFGRPVVITASLPYTALDTSRILLTTGKDTIQRRVAYRMVPDTLKGLMLNGVVLKETHPRIINLEAAFAADTNYRLRLLPGAFTGLNGQQNDTLDVRFKMKNRDQYGTVKITLPDLTGPAVVELLNGQNKVAATRLLPGAGVATFDLMAPGKYTARLVFDDNGNGKWDTGRFSRHLQPEKVAVFSKEMNLKANWEVSETWSWKSAEKE